MPRSTAATDPAAQPRWFLQLSTTASARRASAEASLRDTCRVGARGVEKADARHDPSSRRSGSRGLHRRVGRARSLEHADREHDSRHDYCRRAPGSAASSDSSRLHKGLDGICRRSNRLLDRRFGAAEDAAIAANDYDRLADLMKRANRFDRPFYRAVNKLGARVPERDEAGLRRYLRLSRQLDIFGLRYIRALRAHDDDELGRLNTLIEHTRNKRTRVTATMGLRQCGS
jgi:hypothetical protein